MKGVGGSGSHMTHVYRKSILLKSEREAIKAATAIIKRGRWLQLDPYPEDQWMLTVKNDLQIDERGLPL